MLAGWLAAVLCAGSLCSYSVTSLLQVCSHCNGHGQCWQGECECSEGYATLLTANLTSANRSSLMAINSSTISSVADSVLRWDEVNACTLPSCPLDCNGNGVCVEDSSSQTTLQPHSLSLLLLSVVAVLSHVCPAGC